MREDLNSLETKKIQILLHTNECLHNRTMSNVKLYYDVGVVVISSIILLGIYSVVERKYTLLLAIPLLIVIGEIFYLHLVHMTMKIEWYMINNIELKFDIIEPEILNIARKVGIFRNIVNQSKYASLKFHAKKWIPYLGGYIIFCIGCLAINIGRTNSLEIKPIDLGILKIGTIEFEIIGCSVVIYFLLLLGLILAIWLICREYERYSKDIESLIKKSENKRQ